MRAEKPIGRSKLRKKEICGQQYLQMHQTHP
jgi:hypothetical protein